MNQTAQSGQHPGADQISAFLDQALPAHEREATLAHLAVCPECRAAVTLSQSLAGETATPAHEPSRRPWFSGWRLVWPAAAVTAAALGLVAVFVQRAQIAHRAPARPQVAVVHPPVLASRPITAQKSPATLSPHTRESLRSRREAAPPTAPALSASKNRAVSSPNLVAMAENRLINARKKIETPQNPPVPAPAAAEAPPPPAPSPERVQAGSLAASDESLHGALPARSADVNGLLVAGASAEIFQPSHPLPSGLAVLSAAVEGSMVVAIDSAHAVFVSADAGAHWKPVVIRWKSQPVRVERVAMLAVAGEMAGSNAQAFQLASPRGPFHAGANVAPRAELPKAGASLSGTVTDPSGAVIAHATVEIRNAATHTALVIHTGEDGRYTAPVLAPGDYAIEVRSPGFLAGRARVTITASQPVVQNFTLAVGAASESVMVEAAPATQVEVTPSPAISIPPPPSAAPAPAPPPSPPPTFVLTTADGSRWTSADGATWTRERPPPSR